jgi:hypothetical protein
METYKGILVLCDSESASYLRQTDSAGASFDTLMMCDDTENGDFTPAKVTAAYQCFSDDKKVGPGDKITVFGFLNIPSGTTIRVLHVSSYQKGW